MFYSFDVVYFLLNVNIFKGNLTRRVWVESTMSVFFSEKICKILENGGMEYAIGRGGPSIVSVKYEIFFKKYNWNIVI